MTHADHAFDRRTHQDRTAQRALQQRAEMGSLCVRRGAGKASRAGLRRGSQPVGRDPGLHARARRDPRALPRHAGAGGGASHRGGQGRPRLSAGDSRSPLPARRDHPLGRLPGRLLQALAAGRRAPGGGLHRLLRRALHGGERRHPGRRSPARDPAQPGRRLLHGRHGRRSPGPLLLEAARRGAGPRGGRGHPRHLHELLGGPQGLLRRAGRRGVHVVERGPRAGMGLRARRAGALLPRRAPRAQHRGQARHPRRRDGAVGSAPSPRRQLSPKPCAARA